MQNVNLMIKQKKDIKSAVCSIKTFSTLDTPKVYITEK